MAQILLPTQRAEKQERPKEDSIDKILKGLQVAANITGIYADISRIGEMKESGERAKTEAEERKMASARQEAAFQAGIAEKFQPAEGQQVADFEYGGKKWMLRGESPKQDLRLTTMVDKEGRALAFSPTQQALIPVGGAMPAPKEGGLKPPEKVVKDVRERTVPGVGLASDVMDARSLKEAIEAKERMDRQVDELIELRKKYGVEYVNREAVGRAKQLSRQILLDYKQVAKLGVLSKADEDIINAIIPQDPLGQDMDPFGDPILANLQKFRRDSDIDFNSRLKTRIVEFDPNYKPTYYQIPGTAEGGTAYAGQTQPKSITAEDIDKMDEATIDRLRAELKKKRQP